MAFRFVWRLDRVRRSTGIYSFFVCRGSDFDSQAQQFHNLNKNSLKVVYKSKKHRQMNMIRQDAAGASAAPFCFCYSFLFSRNGDFGAAG